MSFSDCRVDAHESSLITTRAKLYLQYATKTCHKFDNKYMKLFGTRPNVINTFGLRIKQFLTASKRCSDILETSSYLTPWCIKSPKIVLDLVHLKKRIIIFHGNTGLV